MTTIVAAIDFSNASERVLEAAADLARSTGGRLVLVTVIAEPVFLKGYAPLPKSVARISVEHAREIKRRLAVFQERLEAESIPVEVVTPRGDAALHIVKEAEKRGADCIVIGAHGHSALFELVLGSTTQRVLKRARQPVLVIPSKWRRTAHAKLRSSGRKTGRNGL